MTNFSTDADLLKLEPGLFEEFPSVANFFPQHEEARWALLARFGLELDSVLPAELERCRYGTLRQASAALVLATVYRGQAAGEPANEALARKAKHYARLYENKVAKVRLDMEETDPIRRPAMNDVPVLQIGSEETLKDLLADLKSLAKRSARTRAAYSMTLNSDDGKPLVRIEVHFPIERRE